MDYQLPPQPHQEGAQRKRQTSKKPPQAIYGHQSQRNTNQYNGNLLGIKRMQNQERKKNRNVSGGVSNTLVQAQNTIDNGGITYGQKQRNSINYLTVTSPKDNSSLGGPYKVNQLNQRSGRQTENQISQEVLRTTMNKSPTSTAYSSKQGNFGRKKHQGGSMSSNFQTTQGGQRKQRPRTTKLRMNQRFKNSSSQHSIQQQQFGAQSQTTAGFTVNHDTEQGRPPVVPGSINRQNIQSAGYRDRPTNPNFGHAQSTGEDISPLNLGARSKNTTVANDSMVHQIDGLDAGEIGNGSPMNEKESQNQILQVNSYIKQSQLNTISQADRGSYNALQTFDNVRETGNISGLQMSEDNGRNKKLRKGRSSKSFYQNGLYFFDDNETNLRQTRKVNPAKNNARENFRQKRNTVMLPSNFARTDIMAMDAGQYSQYDISRADDGVTPSSADYNIQRVIGKSHVAQAQIKACPQFSFTRSQTHRTNKDNRSNSYERSKSAGRGMTNQHSLSQVSQTGYAYGQGMDGQTMMIFHKTNDHENPGIYDYDALKVQQNLLKKSPKATIGNSRRFPIRDPLNDHMKNLPDQYVKNHQKMQAKPIKLGTFTNEKRWSAAIITPGVGDYDLTRFKNICKANETNFEIPERMETLGSSQKKTRQRAQSAQRSLNNNQYEKRDKFKLQQNRSRSPATSTFGYGRQQTNKRLGGPSSSPTNYMNKASRFQRTLTYNRENEKALLNTLGQGPAEYKTHLFDRIRFGDANKFTIPREERKIILKHEGRKTPISYTSTHVANKLLTKKGSKAIIGQYKQKFDVTKMNPINATIWKKGLM